VVGQWLIRETDTPDLAELHTSRPVLSVAAEVTFNCLLFTLIEIYSLGSKGHALIHPVL